MGEWCNWYRVVKKCGYHAPRYVYEQSTRRVNGRTETRNRYIGIFEGGAVRARGGVVPTGGRARVDVIAKAERAELRAWQTLITNRVEAVRALLEGNRFANEELAAKWWLRKDAKTTAACLRGIDGLIEGDRFARERLAEVIVDLEGIARHELAERNRRVLLQWPSDYLNFNLQAFETAATAVGVDLRRELVRVDGKPTISAKIEALHRLWGVLTKSEGKVGEGDEPFKRASGKSKRDLDTYNRRTAEAHHGGRDYLGFNIYEMAHWATSLHVELSDEMRKVTNHKVIEERREALAQLRGRLFRAVRANAVTSGLLPELAEIRDVAFGEDDETAARIEDLLGDETGSDSGVVRERLLEIAEHARQLVVQQKIGEIVERLHRKAVSEEKGR